MFDRETLPDGATVLRTERCSFTLSRPRPGVFLVRIVGNDRGEFGDAPFDLVLAEIGRFGKLELFVDTSGVEGVVSRVREAWTEWFRTHQPKLTRVHILSGGSRFVATTMHISKELSRTGDLIRIHEDPATFAEALARATADSSRARPAR